MIIDLILDRKENDNMINNGYTHIRCLNGEFKSLKYNPREFYMNVCEYINGCGDYYAVQITRAMDCGTEKDIKRELCRYIIDCGYNESIIDYINSRDWITES